MDPGTGVESPPAAISQVDDDDRAQVDDVASEAGEAAGDLPDPYLFEILKNAGLEIDDDLAMAIRDEIARIKAEGAREAAVISKSAGGTTANTNSILRRLIKRAASGVGYVLVQSLCVYGGIVIFFGVMAYLHEARVI